MNFQVTESIQLKKLKSSDANRIYTLVDQSRNELGEYLYWVKDVINTETAKNYISKLINSGLSGAMWFKIQFNNHDCGVFAIKSICEKTGVAELGYWLSHHFYKKGIISAIVSALPVFLTQNTNAKIIEFRCLEQNSASINIAIKSGAVLVNSMPNYMEIANSNQNLNIYQTKI